MGVSDRLNYIPVSLTDSNMNLRHFPKRALKHSQNAKHRCPMSASCQSMSLSTEPGGSLGGGSNLGIYKEPSLSQEPQVQAVKVSSVLPEFWPCCVLPQSHVLLTLGCSALSLLTLCCPIGNDECILGGD